MDDFLAPLPSGGTELSRGSAIVGTRKECPCVVPKPRARYSATRLEPWSKV